MATPTVLSNVVNRNSVSEGVCSTAFTVTTGDLIVVIGSRYESDFSSYLPTDTQTNTYTLRTNSTGTLSMGLYTGVASQNGSLTVTLSTPGIDLACLFIHIRGQSSDFVHLTGNVTDAATSTTWTLNLSDTTVGETLVVCGFSSIDDFGTFSAGSGWTATNQTNLAPSTCGVYRAADTAGAYDPTGTVTSSRQYSAIGIAIIGAASASTGLPRRALDGPFYGSLRGSVR